MPGVPLDAKSQFKDGLKRLFRKRQESTEQDPNPGSTEPASTPATPAAAPERYEDEVEYEPAKPATTSSVLPAADEFSPPTQGPPSTMQVAQNDQIPTTVNRVGGTPESAPRTAPSAEREENLAPAKADALVADDAPSHDVPLDGKEDAAVAGIGEGGKGLPLAAQTKTPDEKEKDGSPVPAMMATSGPLEDNPTFA